MQFKQCPGRTLFLFGFFASLVLAACSAAPTAPPTATVASAVQPAAPVTAALPAGDLAAATPAAPVADPPEESGPALPTAPAGSPEPILYVVQDGDTLLAIALRYNVTAGDIIAASQLTDPESLSIGQELVIPVGGLPPGVAPVVYHPPAAPVQAPAASFVYRVRAGDTLLAIALRYGVSSAALLAANHLESADRLSVDQELVIPTAGQPVAAETAGDTTATTTTAATAEPAQRAAVNEPATAEPPAPPTEPPAPSTEPPAGAPPTLDQLRAWMEEARAVHPYAEPVDAMWATMMCESGGNPNNVGHGRYYGLFQYLPATWGNPWNPYRDASIFDARAQIFATARAWQDGRQHWWRNCLP